MQSFLSVLLVFGLFHSIQSESKCPQGSFQEANGKCYKVVNQLKTWHQAEVDCYLTGGHLASVTDAFTNAFISNVAKNASITAPDYWLGGTSNYVSGSWNWSNFDQFQYTNWVKGPVNNTIGYCLSQLTSNTLWANESCANEKPYVCEYSQIPCAPAPCPPGWFYANALQKCYLYQNSDAITWNDALAYCQNINSSLASIHSQGENYLMSGNTKLKGGNYDWFWIGLYAPQNTTNYQWIDGSNYDYASYFNTSESNTLGGCAYLRPSLGISNWHIRACNNITGINGFICEVAEQNQTVTASANVFVCPNGTINGNVNGKCYQTFDQPNTWYQAEANCYASGGHLASITDSDMNTFLANKANEALHSDDYWLGGSQYFDGSYGWTNDYSFSYTFWAPSQPSNNTGYCLTQNIDDGTWIASDCTMTKPYICEYIQTLQARCPAAIPCQADMLGISTWLYSDSTEKCYLMLNIYPSYYWTNSYCTSFNATLVSIHSLGENMLISGYAAITGIIYNGNGYWIGIHQNQTNGPFVWVDGSSVNFTSWVNNQQPSSGPIYINPTYAIYNWVRSNDNFTNQAICQTAPFNY